MIGMIILFKNVQKRCWGKNAKSGTLTLDMLSRVSMKCIDIDECMYTGPDYTFCNSRGWKSYVDHCMVSNVLGDSILSCCVWPICDTNLSDHSLVTVTMQVQGIPVESTPILNGHPSWDKLIKQEIKGKVHTCCRFCNCVSVCCI